MNHRSIVLWVFFTLLIGTLQCSFAQSRIPYADRNIFVSGINIAWVDFARDIGPGAPNLSQFATEFKKVHDNGGNVLRLWLHTNGTNTPVFNGQGYVTGPGPDAISNLNQILDLALDNNVGIILGLWSHDMLNQGEMDTARLHRNARLLTDIDVTNSYIENALTPIMDAVAGHPAIVAWEIFNEPEGITNEFGWGGRDHVPMASIQRCINLMAGAIHRSDPTAQVTSAANSFQTLTDVNVIAKTAPTSSNRSATWSTDQKVQYTNEFNKQHRLNLTVEEYMNYLAKIEPLANKNYYSNNELIAAGNDSLGTLDFYCVHYIMSPLAPVYSPFTHPSSTWGLDKPIVIGEFHMQAKDGVSSLNLMPTLYNAGYAGGLVWSWTDFNATNSAADTWTSLQYMYDHHKKDVVITHITGMIYAFEAIPSTIEKTDSTQIIWLVEPGSTVKLDGNPVAAHDSMKIAPLADVSHTLTAAGEVADTARLTVTVLPTGRILAFTVSPSQIGVGESATMIWHVVKGSTVTLNGDPVAVADTVVISPTVTTVYTLIAGGDENASESVTVQVYPPDQVNRALGAGVTTLSNDSVAYSPSRAQNMVDGDDGTRWQSATSPTTQWIRFDLGVVDSINKVVIHWGDHAYAKSYYLSVSTDQVKWTRKITISNGTGGTDYVETIENVNGLGRYVQITFTGKGTERTYYSISELGIYGIPIATGIISEGDGLPSDYSLTQNYPNPFNPTTRIDFSIVKDSRVELTVYNILGERVAVLVDRPMNAGRYTVSFEAGSLASGIYFYRLKAGDFVSPRKMILLK